MRWPVEHSCLFFTSKIQNNNNLFLLCLPSLICFCFCTNASKNPYGKVRHHKQNVYVCWVFWHFFFFEFVYFSDFFYGFYLVEFYKLFFLLLKYLYMRKGYAESKCSWDNGKKLFKHINLFCRITSTFLKCLWYSCK